MGLKMWKVLNIKPPIGSCKYHRLIFRLKSSKIIIKWGLNVFWVMLIIYIVWQGCDGPLSTSDVHRVPQQARPSDRPGPHRVHRPEPRVQQDHNYGPAPSRLPGPRRSRSQAAQGGLLSVWEGLSSYWGCCSFWRTCPMGNFIAGMDQD